MGWSSGSGLLEKIVEEVGKGITPVETYVELIKIFEDYDCDTLHECFGVHPALDIALKRMGYGKDSDV